MPQLSVLAMNRRKFIQAAGVTGAGLTSRLGQANTDQTSTALLKLLEDSPREHLPRALAQRIQSGLRYEELLATLFWAAARNVQPYPVVGFKYHSVMVMRAINASTQQGSPKGPSAERWLPIIWAADYFKDAQAQEQARAGWRLQPRAAGAPAVSAQAVRTRLLAALEHWDHDAADAAIADYARLVPMDEIFSLLFAYGARDLRDIGHKAITVANAHALIGFLDSSQREAILRSTVAALQNSDTDANPGAHDLEPDRPWRINQKRLREIPADWKQGRNDPAARSQLRSELRSALYRESEEQAGGAIVTMLRSGLSPDAIWQVLFNTAAELVMTQPGILTVHAQTTANALYYAYRICRDEPTQQMLLLQCAAFIAMFRQFTAGAADFQLDALQPAEPHGSGIDAIEEIYSEVSAGRRSLAAGKALGYLQTGGDPQALIGVARHHVVYHADEAHDYKFAEAVFENYASLEDAQWRRRYLSAGMAYFKAPAQQPGAVVQETLEALRAG
jgi:hypothetical protein